MSGRGGILHILYAVGCSCTVSYSCSDKNRHRGLGGDAADVSTGDTSPLFSMSTYSLRSIFENVNPTDGRFLKYVPDAFLNDAQLKAKHEVLQKQSAEYANYRKEAKANNEFTPDDDTRQSSKTDVKKSVKDKPRRIVPTPEEAKALDERLKAREEEKAAQKRKERDEMIKRLVYTSPGFAPYRSIKDNLSSMADQYGRIPQGESPARDVTVPVSTDGETKVRRTVRTAMEAEAILT